MSTRSSEVRVIDETVWRLLVAGTVDALPAELRHELAEIELLVPEGEDELATVLARNNEAIARSDELYMVVQPTAACQLGCHYCGQEHTSHRLTEADQDAFVARVASRLASGSYRQLRIGWFGAEPLLGLSVIRRMTPLLRAAAADASCTYVAKIVTNGLLLTGAIARELANELSAELIEVTLDGPPAFHDARRFRKTGGVSFEQIFRNLVDVAGRDDVPATLSVRCNVDRSNAAGVRPLLDLLAAVGLQKRIRFYVAAIHSWGNDAQLGSLTAEEFAEREVGWLAYMMTLGFEPQILPAQKRIVCLATTAEGELVDALGNLFNCTEVSYVPAYGTPNRHRLGHVTGEVAVGDRAVFGAFGDRIERGEVPCRSCSMLPVCGGACPKAWLEGQVPCPSAKENIDYRLVLAYARGVLPDRAWPPVVSVDVALARISPNGAPRADWVDPGPDAVVDRGTRTPVFLSPSRRLTPAPVVN